MNAAARRDYVAVARFGHPGLAHFRRLLRSRAVPRTPTMYGVELYAAVRLAVVEEGLSHHEAGQRFGIDRRTVKKMLSYSAPPGYRRRKPVRRPKLDGFTGIVDAILEADADPEVPRKQFPILGPESTLASRAALASRARGLYMSMIAPMACPTRSAAASISRSPR